MNDKDAAPIAVDRDLCIGSGVCVGYAPGTFDQDEEGLVLIVPVGTGGTGIDDLEAVRTAVEGCPTGALRFTAKIEEKP